MVTSDRPIDSTVVLIKSLVAVVRITDVVEPVLYYNLFLLWSARAHVLLENQ